MAVTHRRHLTHRFVMFCASLLAVGAVAACGNDDPGADEVIGVWRIVGYGPDGELAAPVAGSEPTLAFADDGILQVLAGCNTGLTDWELDGTSLTIGPIAQTLMFCADPPGVMEQEQSISALTEAATGLEVDGDTLRLLSDGAVTIEAERQ